MLRLPLWPLRGFLRTVPDAVHAEVFSQIMNRVLAAQGLEAELDGLEGRRVRLEVADSGNAWQFRISHGALLRDSASVPADVTIRGGVADFLLLVTRAEDPDTLFFERRLSLEGETETGLRVKNLLDSLEVDWDAQLRHALGERVAARLTALGTGPARGPLEAATRRARAMVVQAAGGDPLTQT